MPGDLSGLTLPQQPAQAITDPKLVPGIKSPQQGPLSPDEDVEYKKAQAEASEMNAKLATTILKPPAEPLRPHNMRKGDEPMIACIVPNDFKLNLDDRVTQVHFAAGIREIPAHLLEHWWVKANGVKRQAEG